MSLLEKTYDDGAGILISNHDDQVVFAQTSQGTFGRGAALISAAHAREIASALEAAAAAAEAYKPEAIQVNAPALPGQPGGPSQGIADLVAQLGGTEGLRALLAAAEGKPANAAPVDTPPATPAAIEHAEATGVPLDQVEGTGSGGTITKADVAAAAQADAQAGQP